MTLTSILHGTAKNGGTRFRAVWEGDRTALHGTAIVNLPGTTSPIQRKHGTFYDGTAALNSFGDG